MRRIYFTACGALFGVWLLGLTTLALMTEPGDPRVRTAHETMAHVTLIQGAMPVQDQSGRYTAFVRGRLVAHETVRD